VYSVNRDYPNCFKGEIVVSNPLVVVSLSSTTYSLCQQESLANAKVSVRQQRVYTMKAPSEEIYGK